MVRFVALAVLLAIGAGVYAFLQAANVSAIEVQLTATKAELEKWKTSTSQYQATSKEASANLATCNANLTEVTTQLDAAKAAVAPKRPGAKK
jgi:uncharacterized protein HemX